MSGLHSQYGTPRGLSEEEAEAWAKLAHSVTPIEGRRHPKITTKPAGKTSAKTPIKQAESAMAAMLSNSKSKPAAMVAKPQQTNPKPAPQSSNQTKQTGLDGSWEKKLRSGQIAPDFTLDLHGHNLDSAHARLDSGMMQARAMDARVVLLIAGKLRPVDAADRGTRRGAIRAKILDWLAAGPHGSAIAAVRKAHRRHGGEGALYLILKRRR
ncbi:MAG: Smr/MutS family protein [Erythrobacter sp.]